MARSIIKRGTARDSAEHGVGYVASGESQYSRNVAASANIKLGGYAEPERDDKSIRSLIDHQEKLLKRLRENLAREINPERRAKLQKDYEIKTRFVMKLRLRPDAMGV